MPFRLSQSVPGPVLGLSEQQTRPAIQYCCPLLCFQAVPEAVPEEKEEEFAVLLFCVTLTAVSCIT